MKKDKLMQNVIYKTKQKIMITFIIYHLSFIIYATSSCLYIKARESCGSK